MSDDVWPEGNHNTDTDDAPSQHLSWCSYAATNICSTSINAHFTFLACLAKIPLAKIWSAPHSERQVLHALVLTQGLAMAQSWAKNAVQFTPFVWASVFFLCQKVGHTDAQPFFSTRHISVPLDHFSPGGPGASATFNLRYLVNSDACANVAECPVIFYCGGEGDVIAFANATGFLWEQSTAVGAALVYAEHRYYGTSVPPQHSLGNGEGQFQYLRSQQALADFAVLASNLVYGGNVVAVGGSYGGMLAAWLRQKYPGTFAAALASSAPVLAFEDASTSPLAPTPTGYWGTFRCRELQVQSWWCNIPSVWCVQ